MINYIVLPIQILNIITAGERGGRVDGRREAAYSKRNPVAQSRIRTDKRMIRSGYDREKNYTGALLRGPASRMCELIRRSKNRSRTIISFSHCFRAFVNVLIDTQTR